MKRNNVCVIGNGFVGSKLVTHLRAKDLFNVKHVFGLNYFDSSCIIGELTNLILQNSGEQFDYVVNCVGYTGLPNVDGCEENKEDTYYLNVTWPVLLSTVCAQKGIKVINISSGCIYDGYDKDFNECDIPNFGLLSDESSWYSKTKHACELAIQNFKNTYNFRIRMPITGNTSDRKNYLTKLLKYNKLIDQVNSKTVIDDLLNFVSKFIHTDHILDFPACNYNIVNPEPLSTKQIVDILDDYNLWNPNWSWIELDELYKETACKRSNCILDPTFAMNTVGYILPTEEVSIRSALEKNNF